MLDPTHYAGIIMALYRGGEAPKSEVRPGSVGAMLALCWLIFTLGRLSAALGRLLGVSGVPFGCSWGALGRIMPLMDAPDLDFKGFGRVPAGFGGPLEVVLDILFAC